jgi:hypothetical protein
MTLPKTKPETPTAPTPEPKVEPQTPEPTNTNEKLKAELDQLTAQVEAQELSTKIAEQKAKLETFKVETTEPEHTPQGEDKYEAITEFKPEIIKNLELEADIKKGGS